MTSPSRRPSAGSCATASMEVGIEVGAERLDRPHAALAQDVLEPLVNQLDAAAVGLGALGARLGLQRPLEIVDERQQLLDARSAAAASDSAWRSRSMRLR